MQCPEPVMVPMVMDHDHRASCTICVDREKYEEMLREIEALREQLQKCHVSSFRLQSFADSPDDI